MRVITGIDLPYGSPGGSLEFLKDIYLGANPLIPSDVFMLAPPDRDIAVWDSGLALLSVDGKALEGADFWSYTDRLTVALEERFAADRYDAVHLQHLTFGATPALQRAFPNLPHVAIVHGTDLLFAEEYPTQADVLRRTVRTADAIVVPTAAMAERLAQMVPLSHDRVFHIPWGIPDDLLAHRGLRTQRPSNTLRVLYAGRLTAEKATPSILATVAEVDGVELSVAAPAVEYAQFARRTDLTRARYMGWLARRQLWQEFAHHDLLIVPSLKLEAFGLVGLEAQACGLPVAHQPVPGLSEVLRDSAFAVDFGEPREVIALLKKLIRTPSLLDEIRAAGHVNSARYPLSATASALRQLSVRLSIPNSHSPSIVTR